jgi:hypothetical protein
MRRTTLDVSSCSDVDPAGRAFRPGSLADPRVRRHHHGDQQETHQRPAGQDRGPRGHRSAPIVARRTPRDGQGAARQAASHRPRRLEGARQAEGSDPDPEGRGRRPPAGTRADPLWPHAAVPVRLLPWHGRIDGRRSCEIAKHGPAGPGLRRLPPHELRRFCDAGAQRDLRHKRLRRDAARTVGVGRQAARHVLRARRALGRNAGRHRP